jgi:predicted ATPase
MLSFAKLKTDHYVLFPENSKHSNLIKIYLNDAIDPLFLDNETLAILTHSEVVTAYIRYLVVTNIIDCNKVEFWFVDENKETKIKCNEFGNLSDWLPEMFSSLLIEEEIVKASLRKRA